MAETRKALNFDLDDNLLKEHYPNKNSYKNAWGKISKYLKDRGFEHRQYSGYVSIEPMEISRVIRITRDLSNEFPWLKECVKQFDVTAVQKEYSLLEIIRIGESYSPEILNEETLKNDLMTRIRRNEKKRKQPERTPSSHDEFER